MKSKFLLLVTVAIVAMVGVGAGLFARPYTFHGSLIDPPVPAVDFTLTDQTGQPFRLSEQAGNVVLLFFGYTSCPDVCPATLTQFKRIRTEMGKEADRVRFVLVTVDPQRDTAERLRQYLAGFNSSFVGLTGTWLDLDQVYRSYGVYQAILVPGPAYTVDHTDRVYAIDPKGNLRLTYTSDTTADDLAQDVRQLLKGK
ncbi:MAG TPA: SCO family protein [Anaerolineales bacterium]|nr:SCO family protein [Anaerolineales bacterium]